MAHARSFATVTSSCKMADHHAMEPPIFISSSAVLDLVSMRDIVDAMSSAFLQYSQRSSGAVVQPVRTVLPIQDHNGYAVGTRP